MEVRRSLAAADSDRPRRVRCAGSALAFVIVCGVLAAAVFPDALPATEQREGLAIEYRFEGNAADGSGNSLHGTIHGRPQFVPGKAGQCVQLDGQQDYIDSGTTLADLGQTFTIECWVNPAEHQNPYVDIFGNHSGGGYGFVVEQSADNTYCFAGAYGGGEGSGSACDRSDLRPTNGNTSRWRKRRPSCVCTSMEFLWSVYRTMLRCSTLCCGSNTTRCGRADLSRSDDHCSDTISTCSVLTTQSRWSNRLK